MKWTVVLLFALITFSAYAQSVTPPPRDEELCAAGGRSHGWAPYSPAIPDAACSDDPGLCSADLVDAPCDRRL